MSGSPTNGEHEICSNDVTLTQEHTQSTPTASTSNTHKFYDADFDLPPGGICLVPKVDNKNRPEYILITRLKPDQTSEGGAYHSIIQRHLRAGGNCNNNTLDELDKTRLPLGGPPGGRGLFCVKLQFLHHHRTHATGFASSRGQQ